MLSLWKEQMEPLEEFASKNFISKIHMAVLEKKHSLAVLHYDYAFLMSSYLKSIYMPSRVVQGKQKWVFSNSVEQITLSIKYAILATCYIWTKKILHIILHGYLFIFLEYLALFKAHCPFWHSSYIVLNMCDTTLISIAGDYNITNMGLGPLEGWKQEEKWNVTNIPFIYLFLYLPGKQIIQLRRKQLAKWTFPT